MSQQFGWFKNKYQTSGGATFTPNVNLNEVITANGYQYQAIITSNIPNANLLVAMQGTIPESNVIGGKNTSITTDSFGSATVIKDFETASSNTTFTFTTSVYNPNKLPDLTEARMAIGNVVTLSGTINKRIDVVSYSGSNTDIAKSNITVGSDTYTLYEFQVPGTYTFDITSVANVSKEIQMFSVGSGTGAANVTSGISGFEYFGGGGGAGGHLYTANLTTTEGRLVCNATIGQGGQTLTNQAGSIDIAHGNASIVNIHDESNTLLAGAGLDPFTYQNGMSGTYTTEIIGGPGGLGLSGGGGGYVKSDGSAKPIFVGNEQYSSPPYVFTKGASALGGGTISEHNSPSNVILAGGTDTNLTLSLTSIGNIVPLSYANTSVTGNANIIAQLAGRTGNISTGGIANVGVGGVDFIYDFTGSNASYSGGGAGQGENSATPGMPTFYTGYGAGGYVGNVNVNGANGVIMLRHLQNGTRALSM